jgi:uncharacterized protein (UPF0262 family)
MKREKQRVSYYTASVEASNYNAPVHDNSSPLSLSLSLQVTIIYLLMHPNSWKRVVYVMVSTHVTPIQWIIKLYFGIIKLDY